MLINSKDTVQIIFGNKAIIGRNSIKFRHRKNLTVCLNPRLVTVNEERSKATENLEYSYMNE